MKKFLKKFGKRVTRPERLFSTTGKGLNHRVALFGDRDHMPREVATALLLEPKAHITNRLRKECTDARTIHYVSARTRKDGREKIVSRFSRASIAQIAKWLRRASNGIRKCEQAEDRITGMGDDATKRRQVLMIREAAYDNARLLLLDEFDYREKKITLVQAERKQNRE
jgi:hypothetical protein